MTQEDIIRLRRDLTALRTRIEELRDAIQEHSRTIYAAEERKREADAVLHTVHAVIAYDDQTKRDAKAENDRQHGVQKGIKLAAWCAFGAAVIYATVAGLQWREIRKTAVAAMEQVEVTDRPWIKVEVAPNLDLPVNSLVGQSLTFDADGTGHLSRKIVLQNIGHSVANDVMIRDATVATSVWSHDFWFPVKVRDDLCRTEIRETDAQGNKRPSFIVFPQDSAKTYELSAFETKNIPDNPADAGLKNGKPIALYLVGCVDYRYGVSNAYHRTGFVLEVWGGPNHEGIQIKMPTPVKGLTFDSFYLGGDYAY